MVYAGSENAGLWRSGDGAATWTLQSLSGESLNSIIVHPSTTTTLYTAVPGEGVMRSLDSGVTWTLVNNGAFLPNINFVAMQPGTPSTLYAGTNGNGLFKTTDDAASWTELTTGLPASGNWLRIGFDPSTPATVYVVTYGGALYKSIDSGGSWTAGATGLSNPRQILVDPSDSSIVYIVSYGNDVMKSTDGGASVAPLGSTSCHGYSGLAIDPAIADRLYLSVTGCQHGGTGVFRSDDGGLTWIDSTTSGEPEFVTGLVLEERAPQVLYALTEGGIYTRDLSAVPVELMSFSVE